MQTVVQQATPGAYIALFRIDTTSIGGPVMHFCQSAFIDQEVKFGGVPYTPVDVEFSGFEVNGGGVLPTPKMKVSNTNGVMQDIVNTYGDLLGCPVARVRTFSRFLDGQPDADPSRFIGPDVFRVEQKTAENDVFIEWELSASIDQEGKQLPGRQVLRDVCPWRYRFFNPASNGFVYDPGNNACPYSGAAMFDALDKPTADPTKDVCSQSLAGCQSRYGKNAPLPFGGFLGVARVRA